VRVVTPSLPSIDALAYDDATLALATGARVFAGPPAEPSPLALDGCQPDWRSSAIREEHRIRAECCLSTNWRSSRALVDRGWRLPRRSYRCLALLIVLGSCRALPALLLVVPVLVVFAGCGSDEDRVRHTVSAIIKAANDHDPDRLCELIIWDGDDESCRREFAAGFAGAGESFGPDVKVTNVVFVDGEAHVDLSGGDPDSLVLVNVGGRWPADPAI
jgi:hypothetical protein